MQVGRSGGQTRGSRSLSLSLPAKVFGLGGGRVGHFPCFRAGSATSRLRLIAMPCPPLRLPQRSRDMPPQAPGPRPRTGRHSARLLGSGIWERPACSACADFPPRTAGDGAALCARTPAQPSDMLATRSVVGPFGPRPPALALALWDPQIPRPVRGAGAGTRLPSGAMRRDVRQQHATCNIAMQPGRGAPLRRAPQLQWTQWTQWTELSAFGEVCGPSQPRSGRCPMPQVLLKCAARC